MGCQYMDGYSLEIFKVVSSIYKKYSISVLINKVNDNTNDWNRKYKSNHSQKEDEECNFGQIELESLGYPG